MFAIASSAVKLFCDATGLDIQFVFNFRLLVTLQIIYVEPMSSLLSHKLVKHIGRIACSWRDFESTLNTWMKWYALRPHSMLEALAFENDLSKAA